MNLRSPSVTMLIGTLSLVLLTALGWFLLVGPAVGDLSAANERKSTAQDRSSSMSLQLAKLRAQAEELPEVRRQAAQLARALPPTADQPGFFAAITEAAADAGIGADRITDITQGVPVMLGEESADGAPADDGDLAVLPEPLKNAKVALQQVSVSVSGPYAKLSEVLRQLETMDRVLLMHDVTVAAAESSDDAAGGGGGLTLTIAGVTVIAPPVEDPESPKPRGGSDGGGEDGGGGDTEQASG